jgi:hypothetical protein
MFKHRNVKNSIGRLILLALLLSKLIVKNLPSFQVFFLPWHKHFLSMILKIGYQPIFQVFRPNFSNFSPADQKRSKTFG